MHPSNLLLKLRKVWQAVKISSSPSAPPSGEMLLYFKADEVLYKKNSADVETAIEGGGGATNLAYTPSPTNGVVTSDTGADATLTLADGTNAGLFAPAGFTKLDGITGTNTGDQSLSLGTVGASTAAVNLSGGSSAVIPAATTSTAGLESAADKTKLDGIAAGATANSSDATLLNRANHTGTQAWSTITGTPTTLAGYGITDGASSLATVVAISGPYTITDADQGKILEVTGARTLTVGSLTSAFQACDIIQLDASQSTIAGTFTGDYGSTKTQAVAGTRTFIERVSGGTVYFKGEVG